MIWHVYIKELLDSLRDKKTIYLSVLIPMVMNIGMLYFVDSYGSGKEDKSITVAIGEQADGHVTSWLKQDKSIEVMKVENPVQAVEEGEASIAIRASQNFSEQMTNLNSPEITLYSDLTSGKGDAANAYVSALLEQQQKGLVNEQLLELEVDKRTLSPFVIKAKNVNGEDSSLGMVSMFAPLLIIMTIIAGCLPSANDMFAGEKEKNTMEALLMTPVKKIHLIIGKWLAISTLGMVSGILSLVTFIVFIQYFTKNLGNALDLSSHLGIFSLSLFLGIVLFSLLVGMILSIFSLLANTVKEAQNYASPVLMLAFIPYFLLVGTSINEFTNIDFLIPVYNVYALIKQLLYGVFDITSIGLVTISIGVVIACLFAVANILFSKSKWVLGKS
ncbi:ABC transporter permease subunit [Bacillus sp. 1780r2a1]|uniref:ABC transporter permease n=1 Tax=Priestia TaxID=2800373 RepID=UPI0022011D02|nr:ABC transporter permease [Priestia flexa]MDT2047639.1 ABC transporter permease subunit [Priestia flexa]USY56247.1 ABC transporter permease subunit [Bacillus sp. 1780r2a1]